MLKAPRLHELLYQQKNVYELPELPDKKIHSGNDSLIVHCNYNFLIIKISSTVVSFCPPFPVNIHQMYLKILMIWLVHHGHFMH